MSEKIAEINQAGQYKIRLFWSSIMAIFIAGLGLAGYIPGFELFGSISPGYIPMAPSTVISLILLAVILLIFASSNIMALRINRICITIIAILVSSFGLAKSVEHFVHRGVTFERFLVTTTRKLGLILVGIMSPSTGAMFFLAGVSVLILIFHIGRRRHSKITGNFVGILGNSVVVGSLVFIFGYFYG